MQTTPGAIRGRCGNNTSTYQIIGALSVICSSRRPQAHLPTWKGRLLTEIGETTRTIADVEAQSAAVVQRVEILLDAIKGADACRRASLSQSARDRHRATADVAAKEADALLSIRWEHPLFPRAKRPIPPTAGEIRRGIDRYRRITAARVAVRRAHIALLEAFLREDGSADRAWSAESVAEQKLAALLRGGE